MRKRSLWHERPQVLQATPTLGGLSGSLVVQPDPGSFAALAFCIGIGGVARRTFGDGDASRRRQHFDIGCQCLDSSRDVYR